jgi:regulator of cell morphogenesis and NO signaling
MRDLSVTTPVGEIVARDPRTAVVFTRHNIDFCCGGRRTLADACAAEHVASDTVLAELQTLADGGEPAADPTTWPAGTLIDHIVTRHHAYVRVQHPIITMYLEKIVARHGKAHPELSEVAGTFMWLRDDLLLHMQKEEAVLFPYIRRMDDARRHGGAIPHAPFGSVANPVAMMVHEHEQAANALVKLRTLTNGSAVPADGCATYKAAMSALADFDRDLREHVHLENNVLFPAAELLERELA